MNEADGSYEKIVWMSSKEAAEYLGVSLQTLYRFIDNGSLTAYQMGRVIRLKYVDVIAFIESNRIGPGTLNSVLSRAENT